MAPNMLGKKAKITFFEDWVEILFFCLLIIGFLVSASVAKSAFLSYIIIVLCGFMAGRLFQHRKGKFKFPSYLIVIGFLVGYIIGDFYGNKKVTIFLFIVGIIFGYYVHEKGYIK